MLLLSAGKLFQDVGYVQASINRIASAVNAPKGTFYNYFKSKEDLASRLIVTSPSFCTTTSERVYITARACELEFGGIGGIQAAGAGGL